MQGLERGDILYLAVENSLSTIAMESSKGNGIYGYLLFLIENPDWKMEHGGSPANLLLSSTGFDFKFASNEEMNEFYSNCPYKVR